MPRWPRCPHGFRLEEAEGDQCPADRPPGQDLNHSAAAVQGELFTLWRYHAVFTDSPFATLQAEEHHRDHAQVEQVFADLADRHLPSGSFPANAAWLACADIAHNLVRAAGSLASLTCAKARGATLRRDLISVAARIARHGHRHITLHLPQDWHRETGRMTLFDAACGPPLPRPDQPRPGHRILAACTGHLAIPNPRTDHGQAAESGRQISYARVTHKISPQSRPPEKRSPEFTRWTEA
jgi:hypothetical protein